MTEIGGAVFTRRGSHGDEDELGLVDARGQIIGKRELAALHTLRNERREAGLENRYVAGMQPRELALVVIDANDIVAHFRETGPRYKTNVARSDH